MYSKAIMAQIRHLIFPWTIQYANLILLDVQWILLTITFLLLKVFAKRIFFTLPN